MSDSPNRRLAAIFAADVAGYSRLVGLDEERTVSDLRVHRQDLIDPSLARHRGRIANTAGDSLLVEFSSVVDAVRCAAEIQQGMAERTKDQPPEGRIAFRIGIHVGDVLAAGDDLLGDGVNIAARIEALCTPGGILLSDAAHTQVRDRLDHEFHDVGEHRVKNIARPIRVWGWASDAAAASGGDADDPRPSIAVLAFNNMSGDPEQTYFAEGIAEDIITDLSKVSGLMVIARNSSFAYRGQTPDIRRVCRELGVRYVLEGSVRKAGGRIRINAQMIDGTTGGHLWADRFDRDLSDVFAVQDEVTAEIVAALQIALTPDEKINRENRRQQIDPQAYDLFLQAREHLLRFTQESADEARAALKEVIAREPGFSTAYAGLAILHCTEYLNGWNDPGTEPLDKALTLAEKAIEIDEHDADAWHASALVNLWLRNYERAESSARRAIAVQPSYAAAIGALGQVADFTGRHALAVECADRALKIDPRYDVLLQMKGRALFGLQRYEDAVEALEERLRHRPTSDMSRVFLAASLGHLGRADQASHRWVEAMELNPDFSFDRLRRTFVYTSPDVIDRLAEGLTLAGISA